MTGAHMTDVEALEFMAKIGLPGCVINRSRPGFVSFELGVGAEQIGIDMRDSPLVDGVLEPIAKALKKMAFRV